MSQHSAKQIHPAVAPPMAVNRLASHSGAPARIPRLRLFMKYGMFT